VLEGVLAGPLHRVHGGPVDRMSRERTIEEVGEDLDEIKAALTSLSDKLDQRFVPRELYEAKHESLRHEIAREFASLKAAMERGDTHNENVANAARTLAQWCFGTVAVAVITALVGFLVAGGPA
jgi:hypothetical protein